MKIGNKIHCLVYIVLFVLIGYLFFIRSKNKEVAIVNAQTVLENYQGFREAQDLYELKTQEMSKTFDKQKSTYESKSNELKILTEKLSEKEFKIREKELEILKAKTFQLGKSIENKAIEQEEILLQGVYNKVNGFIERYAKNNGIDLISGVTTSGNVLYASEAIDITDKIIQGLNKEYVEGIDN
ncbi:OmpH family outer membrane protein [Tamlana sp. 2_MG-2023]|uniref:OmpH family outer membrane protein n=1 Tax=unclassified Tamlana TaxID=2614803 RepID=UPI0026E41EA6|nr:MULTISPECIES: OmpH family outer membrane protein [unclassified Tamlana]MDO6761763.1 OmpH family outer membrane protein [Tamlana sp. 2_MG-2023]MDO6792524.1 OmpH family outer membrane protein [Tamlana sp. 1_MG-2023]